MHVKSYTTMTNAAIFIWTLQTETENADICCIRKVTRNWKLNLRESCKSGPKSNSRLASFLSYEDSSSFTPFCLAFSCGLPSTLIKHFPQP